MENIKETSKETIDGFPGDSTTLKKKIENSIGSIKKDLKFSTPEESNEFNCLTNNTSSFTIQPVDLIENEKFHKFAKFFKFDDINELEMIAYFVSKGINPQHFQMTDLEKEQVSDLQQKYHNKPLFQHFLSQIEIAHFESNSDNENADYWQRTEKLVNDLIKFSEKHDFIRNLLNVIDKELRIELDFKSDHVEQAFVALDTSTMGIFDQFKKVIVVGTKNDYDVGSDAYTVRNWNILGTIIHEITHFVMNMVYENNCKPYFAKNDETREEKFLTIVKDCKLKKGENDKIVANVYKSYQRDSRPAELIVRVPQMIVEYGQLEPERLQKLSQETYKDLFDYFFKICGFEICEYLKPEKELMRKVKRVSTVNINQFQFKSKQKELYFDDKIPFHFVITNVPELAMANFVLNFPLKNFPIFTKMTDLLDETKSKNILSVWKSNTLIPIVVLCDLRNEPGMIDLIKELNSNYFNKKIIILRKQEFERINFYLVNEIYKLKFDFSDLDEESQEKVLNKKILFQGTNILLKDIFTDHDIIDKIKQLENLPLSQIVESKLPLIIYRSIEKNVEFEKNLFIHRDITADGCKVANTSDFETIIKVMSENRYLVITGDAGVGKSSIMSLLAEKFLTSNFPHIKGKLLVIKFKLQQNVDILMKFNDQTQLDDFLFDNFIKCSELKSFEREIFNEFFTNKRIILMLDGFDEICPICETPTVKMIQKALSSRISNVIVASRFSDDRLRIIEEKPLELKLENLSLRSQKKYFEDYFKLKEEEAGIRNESSSLIHCDDAFIICYSGPLNSLYNQGILCNPLFLKLYTEIVYESINGKNNADEALKSLNLYDLYETFFKNKEKIAKRDKGSIVLDNIQNPEYDFQALNITDCATKLALITIHPSYFNNSIRSPLRIEEMEYMRSYGIAGIHYIEGEMKAFIIHRSFAEFLIAKLFLKEIFYGNLSDSILMEENFLYRILMDLKYEIILQFVDQWLSKNWNKFTPGNLKKLSKTLIMVANHANYDLNDFERQRKRKIRFEYLSKIVKISLEKCDISDVISSNISNPEKFCKMLVFLDIILQEKETIFEILSRNDLNQVKQVFYAKLDETLAENPNLMSEYFNHFGIFFNTKILTYNFIKSCLTFFVNILDGEYLIQFLTCKKPEIFSMEVEKILSDDFLEFPNYFLNLFKQKITEKQKNHLYEIIDEYHLLLILSNDKEEFLKIFSSCKTDFTDYQIQKLILSDEFELKVHLHSSTVCEQIVDFLLSRNLDSNDWQKVLFKENQNDKETKIFQLLNQSSFDSAKILLEVALKFFERDEFVKLLNLETKSGSSISMLLRNYNEIYPENKMFEEYL